jgi:hypothetical protein
MGKLTFIKLLDTTFFQGWGMANYNMSKEDWHTIIWRKSFCNFFMEGPYAQFERIENPKEDWENHLNAFFDAYPELEDSVKMIFTN